MFLCHEPTGKSNRNQWTTKRQNCPLPTGNLDPYLTQIFDQNPVLFSQDAWLPCLGPTPLTTPNGSCMASEVLTQQCHHSQLVIMHFPIYTPKTPPYRHCTVHILGPSRPLSQMASRSSQLFFHNSDRHNLTDRQTDQHCLNSFQTLDEKY